jgi:hypothetical protein
MSAWERRAIECLFKSVEEHSPEIIRTLSAAGVSSRDARALVFSAAKYYEALDRLAQE